MDGLVGGNNRVFITMPVQTDVVAGFQFAAGTDGSTLANVFMDMVPNAAFASSPGGDEGTVTVDFATQNGTAIAPGDYTATSGTLTSAPASHRRPSPSPSPRTRCPSPRKASPSC